VVVAISEVRRIVERVCARQDILDACAERDLGYVIAALNENGERKGRLPVLFTGLHQNRLSDYKTGKHQPKEYSVFAAFADGLGLPQAASRALGMGADSPAAGIGAPQPRPASFGEISLEYPVTMAQAAGNLASLWRADLADEGALVRGGLDPRAWVMPRCGGWSIRSARRKRTGWGARAGMGDVERFRVTAGVFGQLDDRFGGGMPGRL
jgi:hypothetical protein